MVQELEKWHRLELNNINCENWLKLEGQTIFMGGQNASLKPPKNSVNSYASVYDLNVAAGSVSCRTIYGSCCACSCHSFGIHLVLPSFSSVKTVYTS